MPDLMAGAIGGSSLLGLGGSILGADAQRSAGNKAADATVQGANIASQAQRDMYQTTRQDFAPFLQPSSRAMATLQSAIYGGPQQYVDPSYTALTPEETRQHLAGQAGPQSLADNPLLGNIFHPQQRPSGNIFGMQIPQQSSGPAASPNLNPYYRDAQGNITQTPGMLSATFAPQESESYKWQKQRGLEDLDRMLRMRGRSNSTYGMNTTGRFLGDLNAGESDKQYSRLLDLVKTGQGAAGSTGSAGQGAAGNLSSIAQNQGNSLASIAMQQGQSQGNLYGGIGGAINGTLGNAMMYGYGKKQGYWG